LWKAGADARFASEAPGASKSLCGVKGNSTQQLLGALERGEVKRFQPDALLKAQAIPTDFDCDQLAQVL